MDELMNLGIPLPARHCHMCRVEDSAGRQRKTGSVLTTSQIAQPHTSRFFNNLAIWSMSEESLEKLHIGVWVCLQMLSCSPRRKKKAILRLRFFEKRHSVYMKG